MSDQLNPTAESLGVAPQVPAAPEVPAIPEKRNPLLDLTESQKEDLFVYLREGADEEVIAEKLQELGCPATTRRHIDHFFKIFAQERWTKRVDRAAQEAEALIQLVRRSPSQFSEGVLAALGQEAFRQIASGKVEPDALAKYTSLFLRAKEQDRAERALLIQGERLRVMQRNSTEKALDSFARSLPKNPAAFEAFKKLKDQLLDDTTHLEEAE
jgi:hypothetical protein